MTELTRTEPMPGATPGAMPGATPGEGPRHRSLIPRSRLPRTAMAVAVIALTAAFIAVWALPNVAGAAFLDVRAVVRARQAATGPMVTLAGATSTQASAIDVAVEIDNRYPLAVVVGTDTAAFQATVWSRDGSGRLARVWAISVDDPVLEEGSDSPAGGAASGAAVVPSGFSHHELTGGTYAFNLVDASGASLPAGVYYLQVWAYGVGSGLVPIALDGATDTLGPPATLPRP